MGTLNQFINGGVMAMESAFSNPMITFDGTSALSGSSFVVIANGLEDKGKTELIGLEETAGVNFSIRTNQFNGIYPQLKDMIYYPVFGRTYKVAVSSITKPVHNQFWILHCDILEVGYVK